jgi:SAM-dependent methyltransferase
VTELVDPLDLYGAGLRGMPLFLRRADGRRYPVATRRWTSGLQPGDTSLLDRCSGTTLDVGCGPGRLTVALTRRGLPALGIDFSDVAVRLARDAGATVLARDVFAPLPGNSRWATVLLADENLGIGGNPVRLLARCRELITDEGRILVELARTSDGGEPAVRLEDDFGRTSTWFPWVSLDPPGLATVARRAGLRVLESWSAAGRPFAALGRADGWT